MVQIEYKKYFVLQIAYTEAYEQQRGKGSFPAMITPGYHLAKKAQENASDVSIQASEQIRMNTYKSWKQRTILEALWE